MIIVSIMIQRACKLKAVLAVSHRVALLSVCRFPVEKLLAQGEDAGGQLQHQQHDPHPRQSPRLRLVGGAWLQGVELPGSVALLHQVRKQPCDGDVAKGYMGFLHLLLLLRSNAGMMMPNLEMDVLYDILKSQHGRDGIQSSPAMQYDINRVMTKWSGLNKTAHYKG